MDEGTRGVMSALNLVERIYKDGIDGWQQAWDAEPDQEGIARVQALMIAYLLENDSARRDVTWDELFDQVRSEYLESRQEG
ncbi:hypothetical protein ACFWWC_03545 [Streptomyces sp. NPDC058642]|uniref:hypothetical protein n=1 Tax=Streptomyces sp. NPDC058642 TaxID=3346572 RepID=UPI0036481531